MKRIVILLMGIFSMFGLKAADYRSVAADEFEQLIADSAVVRLDVRTPQEYAEGHIPGALLIDVNADDFMQKAERLLPKGRTVALYCRSGRRSKRAAELLASAGYDVVELSTGWLGWKAAGK